MKTLQGRWFRYGSAAAALAGAVAFGFEGPQTRIANTRSESRPTVRVAPPPFGRLTPEEAGIDPRRLELAYQRAETIPQIYSMLVIRHGRLVAEEYFNGQTAARANPVASVGKSILGALVGVALERGHLESLDQPMIGFFPEYDHAGLDPRKRQITIGHLIEMRAGYPFDSTTEFFDLLVASPDWMGFIINDWRLYRRPGREWNYSNASAHLLAGILTKATGMPLLDYANRHLFGRMGQPIRTWPRDPQGYCVGPGDVHCTPIQLASLGRMMLEHGTWRGCQILTEDWVRDSLEIRSATWYGNDIWPYRDISYGRLWWSAEVNGRAVHFAWGHGGQFITIVPSLDLVVVTTAFNFVGDFTNNSWITEGGIFRLIATDVIPAVVD